MEHSAPIWLTYGFLYLTAAVLAVPIARALGLGAIIGYLAAGIAIGPWGAGLVTNVEDILHFAEFGVVLMLFVIGLELQPSRLWELRRPILGWGLAQMLAWRNGRLVFFNEPLLTVVDLSALERGEIVISDRYLDSSVAYQGVARGLGAERVAELSLWATGGLVPDLTIVLDVDPALGLARVVGPDRLESEPLEWHARVRQGFLDIAAAAPDRYLVLDGSRPAEDLAVEIAVAVSALVGDA